MSVLTVLVGGEGAVDEIGRSWWRVETKEGRVSWIRECVAFEPPLYLSPGLASRCEARRSDLIGPTAGRAVVARCGQDGPRNAADSPANRANPRVLGAGGAVVQKVEPGLILRDCAGNDGVGDDERPRPHLVESDSFVVGQDGESIAVPSDALERAVVVSDEGRPHEAAVVVHANLAADAHGGSVCGAGRTT